jgi:hypothetical protein
MATFLSAAVFVNEIDLSALPASTSGILPGFVGTAQKGPVNEPIAITSAQNYIDTFGNPFPESYLGYAVLAFMEEGNLCWVSRVGVACEEGQPEELSDICIDVSGNREGGWGRIPVFSGIDFGTITTRQPGEGGWVFHDDSLDFIGYNDALLSSTDGPTDALLTFTGGSYTGSVDDSFLMLMTSGPSITSGSVMDGASYTITRTSDGAEVANDVLVESGTLGTSEDIVLQDGIVLQVVVTSGVLDANDTFGFAVQPDNRVFSFRVNNEEIGGVADPEKPVTFTMDEGTIDKAEDFATIFNALDNGVGQDNPTTSGSITMQEQDYFAVANDDGTVSIRTEIAGQSIQLHSTEAFALEIGQSLYSVDIPRSNLIGLQPEPFDITSDNNIVDFAIDNQQTGERIEITVTMPVGFNQPASNLAAAINASSIVAGNTVMKAYPVAIPGGTVHLVIETTDDNPFDQIKMLADGAHPKTVRFADEVGFQFPFTESYRGFRDSRETLPQGGEVDEANPRSCELIGTPEFDFGACQADSQYYQNIVGWFVATSAGTWIDGFKVDVELWAGTVQDDAEAVGSNTYEVRVTDNQDVLVSRIENVSFDPTQDNYIANLINPDDAGVGGNEYINWINRPEFLQNDPNDLDDFAVREPASFFDREFEGQANGIPSDPLFSSELDRAVIGNPAAQTGIYNFADPEQFDISLLLTPGFSSGAVIVTGISVCTQRGDCLYIVDPPFGLNAQQVVDWHNGMLFNDLQVALDSSYGALYHPWVRIFDQFNGGEIFIPPSGHVSAVFARTDRVAEVWFAPAGLNRGKLITALGVETEHNRGQRDLMYGFNNAVNPIINFPQRGIHIWGQRTLQRKDSALDRVNVRMLLIAIKKALAGPRGLLNEFLFEQNDAITRQLVTDAVDNFMNDVANRRGVTAWKTICDETNNTPIRIDRNELWISLLIKPTRVIEFIVLNIGILRTDQSFTSEEVLGAVGVNTVS